MQEPPLKLQEAKSHRIQEAKSHQKFCLIICYNIKQKWSSRVPSRYALIYGLLMKEDIYSVIVKHYNITRHYLAGYQIYRIFLYLSLSIFLKLFTHRHNSILHRILLKYMYKEVSITSSNKYHTTAHGYINCVVYLFSCKETKVWIRFNFYLYWIIIIISYIERMFFYSLYSSLFLLYISNPCDILFNKNLTFIVVYSNRTTCIYTSVVFSFHLWEKVF